MYLIYFTENLFWEDVLEQNTVECQSAVAVSPTIDKTSEVSFRRFTKLSVPITY